MIVTPEQIRAIRPIARNISNERIEPYIEEVEQLFVMPALGPELYKQIDENPERFSDLLAGGYYDGDRNYSAGLRRAIGYMVYARFLRNQSLNATAYGLVLKNGQLSEPAPDAAVARAANEAQSVGEKYLAESVAFAKYSGLIDCAGQSRFRRKFRVIGD